MTLDLLLYLTFIGLGVIIGMNISQTERQDESKLPNEIKKLKEQLIVMTNVKNSLLEDVRYWRDKANKHDSQRK